MIGVFSVLMLLVSITHSIQPDNEKDVVDLWNAVNDKTDTEMSCNESSLDLSADQRAHKLCVFPTPLKWSCGVTCAPGYLGPVATRFCIAKDQWNEGNPSCLPCEVKCAQYSHGCSCKQD